MTSTELEDWHPGEVDTDPAHLAYAEVDAEIVDRYVQGRLASLGELGEWLSNCGWGLHQSGWNGLYMLMRSPAEVGRLVRDSPRGLVVVLAAWARWVNGSRRVERHRLAVTATEKKEAEDDQKRDRIVGAVVTFLFVAAVAGWTWWGWHHMPFRMLASWFGVVLALGVVARFSRGERVLPRPQVPVGRVITSSAIVEAFAPLCKRDAAAIVLGVPHRKGDGWYAVVQVPAGLEVSSVVQRRATIAQGLKVAEDRVTIDPLPLSAADQLGLYVADSHPLEVKVGTSPVLDADEVDVWQGVPLGVSPTGLVVLSLAEAHVLISGATGTGKTHVARNLINAALVDPLCQPIEWDFKGDGDFTVYRPVMQVHEGDDEETVQAFSEWLDWLRRSEMPKRAAALRGLVESGATDQPKLTRRHAADLGLPLLLVHVDEVQIPLSWGKPLQDRIAENLLHVARTGRSKGVRLVLSTQRPDSGAIDTALRAQLTARLCLKVDNGDSSRAALGVRADSGWDADALPAIPGAAIALGPGILPGATRLRCFPSEVADARTVVKRIGPRVQDAPVNRPELHVVQDRPALPEVLRVALAAWPNPGRDAHSDILAGNIGWLRQDLVKAMRREGVEHRTVYMPRTDAERPQQAGFKLADVEAAARRYGWER